MLGWSRRPWWNSGRLIYCDYDVALPYLLTQYQRENLSKIVLLIGLKSPTTDFSNVYVLAWESIEYEWQYLFLSLSLSYFCES